MPVLDLLTSEPSWDDPEWPVLSPHNHHHPRIEYEDFGTLLPAEPKEPLTIHSLRTEILLEAFEYLTYKDLKLSVRLVCTKFNSILTSHTGGAIQRILFRDAPLTTNKDNDNDNDTTTTVTPSIIADHIAIHPIFSNISYGFTPRLSDILITSNLKPLQCSSTSRENAISPSVSKLTLCFKDTYTTDVIPAAPKPIKTEESTNVPVVVGSGGVSVWDVMRHAVSMIQLMETESEDMYAAYHDLPPGKKSKKARRRMRQQMEAAVQMRLPSERYEWAGVERVEVKEDGKVCLHIKVRWKRSSSH